MALRRFKCSQLHEGTLDFNFECIKLLRNDFCKQRHITLNVTIPGQDRICPKTLLCRTFFAEYIKGNDSNTKRHFGIIFYLSVAMAFDNSNLLALFISDFKKVPDLAPFLQPT